jgi:hypothetical protein
LDLIAGAYPKELLHVFEGREATYRMGRPTSIVTATRL